MDKHPHAVGEVVSVRELMEADEELVQIPLSYDLASSPFKSAVEE
jgi:hypothetical protein